MRTRVGFAAAVLVVSACTASSPSTSSTSSSLPPSTTTTQADRCPDEFCVFFRLDQDAIWSDGEPVTAADFVHTFELATNDPSSDAVYRLITGVEELGDEELMISFSAPAPFERLFEVVLPSHDDAVTSGGFLWEGSQLVGDGMSVEVLVAEGVRGVIQTLRRGEADAGWLVDPPAWAVEELAALDGVSVAAGPGPDWEMVTFNQSNTLLAEEWVRETVAAALDREAILDATVRTVDPGAIALGSTMWLDGSSRYPHDHDTEAARRTLEDHGCTLGADAVYDCGGRRMSFVWATSAGDVWREAALDLAVGQLGEAGIEVIPSLLIPSDLYDDEHLFGDGWDITSFAWTAHPDPRASVELYRCDGLLNIGGHCVDALDDLIVAAMKSSDPEERRRLFSEVDREFVSSAAIIPLFRRPVVWAAMNGLAAPGSLGGPFDGVGGWEGEVRLVLPDLPGDPASVGPVDQVTASLRRSLYRGAFRLLPDGGYAPDLVVGTDAVGG